MYVHNKNNNEPTDVFHKTRNAMKSTHILHAILILHQVVPSVSQTLVDEELGEPNWSNLQGLLSANASIHEVNSNSVYDTSCNTLGTNAYAISAAANGICMHSPDCAYEFCYPDLDHDNYDLPSYTFDVRTENDVASILQFINENEILSKYDQFSSVAVKTTGHSYQGSSTAKDSLLIWMYHFQKDGNITTDYQSEFDFLMNFVSKRISC